MIATPYVQTNVYLTSCVNYEPSLKWMDAGILGLGVKNEWMETIILPHAYITYQYHPIDRGKGT